MKFALKARDGGLDSDSESCRPHHGPVHTSPPVLTAAPIWPTLPALDGAQVTHSSGGEPFPVSAPGGIPRYGEALRQAFGQEVSEQGSDV